MSELKTVVLVRVYKGRSISGHKVIRDVESRPIRRVFHATKREGEMVLGPQIDKKTKSALSIYSSL